MKKSKTLIIVGVVIVALVGIFIGKYNSMVGLSEDVDAKFSNIDTQLQRRVDLIPNLVNAVKGYMAHEQEAIDKVTDARAKLANASNVAEKAEADNELTSALNNFLAIAENYPDLKASENFTNLTDELAGTENRIAVARKDYNDAVKDFNTSIKRFPNNIFAGMFCFAEKDYFKAAEGASEVPTVQFDTNN